MERDTRQRRAIRRAFDVANRPLAPQEVLEAAAEDAPGVSIATIYRNIKALVEDGSLVTVDLPGQSPRYENSGKAHHHHFHCRGCGRVYELMRCCPDVGGLAPDGFRVEEHEIVLTGTCRDCTRPRSLS